MCDFPADLKSLLCFLKYPVWACAVTQAVLHAEMEMI